MKTSAMLSTLILFCALVPELSSQQTRPRIVPGIDGFSLGTQTRSHYYLLLPDRESAWYATLGLRYPVRLPERPEEQGAVTRQLEGDAGFIQTLLGDRRYAPAALDLSMSVDARLRDVSDSTTRLELNPRLAVRLSSGPDRSPWATRRGEIAAWSGVRSSLVVSDAQGPAPRSALPHAGLSASLRRAIVGRWLMIDASVEAEQVFGSQEAMTKAVQHSPWMLVYADTDRAPTRPGPRSAGATADLAIRSRLAQFRWYAEWALEAVLGAQTSAGADTMGDLPGVWMGRAEADTSFSWRTGFTLRTRHVPVDLDLSLHAGVAVDALDSSRRRGYVLFESRAAGD